MRGNVKIANKILLWLVGCPAIHNSKVTQVCVTYTHLG